MSMDKAMRRMSKEQATQVQVGDVILVGVRKDRPAVVNADYKRGIEVKALEPGRRFAMATAQGPFPMETTYTFEDVSDGTEMTLRNRGEPSGFAAVTAPMMAAAMRRTNQADLRRLKELLENSASQVG